MLVYSIFHKGKFFFIIIFFYIYLRYNNHVAFFVQDSTIKIKTWYLMRIIIFGTIFLGYW